MNINFTWRKGTKEIVMITSATIQPNPLNMYGCCCFR